MDGFIVIDKIFSTVENIALEFETDIKMKEDLDGEKYFSYGALLFAKPIESIAQKGKIYATGFEDWMYVPKERNHYSFISNNHATFINGKLIVDLKNDSNHQIEKITLIPFGKTILRQVSF